MLIGSPPSSDVVTPGTYDASFKKSRHSQEGSSSNVLDEGEFLEVRLRGAW
jgi:hypothetical protein